MRIIRDEEFLKRLDAAAETEIYKQEKRIIELELKLTALLAEKDRYLAEIEDLKKHRCEYAIDGGGCLAEDRHFQKTIELERKNAELKECLKEAFLRTFDGDRIRPDDQAMYGKWKNALKKS